MSARTWWFVLAVVVVAWLTAGGMAVRSVSRIWLRHWAEHRLRGAAAALTYLERPQRLLVAASTGVAFTLVVTGALLAAGASGWTLVWQLVVLGGVVVLFGQMVPRAIARRWAPSLVPVLLPVLEVTETLALPVVGLGRRIVRRLEPPASASTEDMERDVIQDLLREGEMEGVGEHDEIAIISGVVEFGEKTVRDVMTPRQDIFALEETTDARTLAERIAQSAYSRVPIYRGSLAEVIGMVLAFDVLKAGGESVPPLRPVTYALPAMPLNDLLFRMLRGRQHLAIVRDEAGHTLGLVTLEDLLEELVGDIRDEHDEPEPPRAAGAAPSSGAKTP